MVDLKPISDEPMDVVDEDVVMSDEPVIKRWTTEEDLTEGAALKRKTQSLADFTQGKMFEKEPLLRVKFCLSDCHLEGFQIFLKFFKYVESS